MASRCLACRQELPHHAPDCTIKAQSIRGTKVNLVLVDDVQPVAKTRKIFANHRYRK